MKLELPGVRCDMRLLKRFFSAVAERLAEDPAGTLTLTQCALLVPLPPELSGPYEVIVTKDPRRRFVVNGNLVSLAPEAWATTSRSAADACAGDGPASFRSSAAASTSQQPGWIALGSRNSPSVHNEGSVSSAGRSSIGGGQPLPALGAPAPSQLSSSSTPRRYNDRSRIDPRGMDLEQWLDTAAAVLACVRQPCILTVLGQILPQPPTKFAPSYSQVLADDPKGRFGIVLLPDAAVVLLCQPQPKRAGAPTSAATGSATPAVSVASFPASSTIVPDSAASSSAQVESASAAPPLAATPPEQPHSDSADAGDLQPSLQVESAPSFNSPPAQPGVPALNEELWRIRDVIADVWTNSQTTQNDAADHASRQPAALGEASAPSAASTIINGLSTTDINRASLPYAPLLPVASSFASETEGGALADGAGGITRERMMHDSDHHPTDDDGHPDDDYDHDDSDMLMDIMADIQADLAAAEHQDADGRSGFDGNADVGAGNGSEEEALLEWLAQQSKSKPGSDDAARQSSMQAENVQDGLASASDRSVLSEGGASASVGTDIAVPAPAQQPPTSATRDTVGASPALDAAERMRARAEERRVLQRAFCDQVAHFVVSESKRTGAPVPLCVIAQHFKRPFGGVGWRPSGHLMGDERKRFVVFKPDPKSAELSIMLLPESNWLPAPPNIESSASGNIGAASPLASGEAAAAAAAVAAPRAARADAVPDSASKSSTDGGGAGNLEQAPESAAGDTAHKQMYGLALTYDRLTMTWLDTVAAYLVQHGRCDIAALLVGVGKPDTMQKLYNGVKMPHGPAALLCGDPCNRFIGCRVREDECDVRLRHRPSWLARPASSDTGSVVVLMPQDSESDVFVPFAVSSSLQSDAELSQGYCFSAMKWLDEASGFLGSRVSAACLQEVAQIVPAPSFRGNVNRLAWNWLHLDPRRRFVISNGFHDMRVSFDPRTVMVSLKRQDRWLPSSAAPSFTHEVIIRRLPSDDDNSANAAAAASTSVATAAAVGASTGAVSAPASVGGGTAGATALLSTYREEGPHYNEGTLEWMRSVWGFLARVDEENLSSLDNRVPKPSQSPSTIKKYLSFDPEERFVFREVSNDRGVVTTYVSLKRRPATRRQSKLDATEDLLQYRFGGDRIASSDDGRMSELKQTLTPGPGTTPAWQKSETVGPQELLLRAAIRFLFNRWIDGIFEMPVSVLGKSTHPQIETFIRADPLKRFHTFAVNSEVRASLTSPTVFLMCRTGIGAMHTLNSMGPGDRARSVLPAGTDIFASSRAQHLHNLTLVRRAEISKLTDIRKSVKQPDVLTWINSAFHIVKANGGTLQMRELMTASGSPREALHGSRPAELAALLAFDPQARFVVDQLADSGKLLVRLVEVPRNPGHADSAVTSFIRKVSKYLPEDPDSQLDAAIGASQAEDEGAAAAAAAAAGSRGTVHAVNDDGANARSPAGPPGNAFVQQAAAAAGAAETAMPPVSTRTNDPRAAAAVTGFAFDVRGNQSKHSGSRPPLDAGVAIGAALTSMRADMRESRDRLFRSRRGVVVLDESHSCSATDDGGDACIPSVGLLGNIEGCMDYDGNYSTIDARASSATIGSAAAAVQRDPLVFINHDEPFSAVAIGSDADDVGHTLRTVIGGWARPWQLAGDAAGQRSGLPSSTLVLHYDPAGHGSTFIERLFNSQKNGRVTILVPPFSYRRRREFYLDQFGLGVNVQPISFGWSRLSPAQLSRLFGLDPSTTGKQDVTAHSAHLKACFDHFTRSLVDGTVPCWPSFDTFLGYLSDLPGWSTSGTSASPDAAAADIRAFLQAMPMARFIAESNISAANPGAAATWLSSAARLLQPCGGDELTIVDLYDPVWDMIPSSTWGINNVAAVLLELFHAATVPSASAADSRPLSGPAAVQALEQQRKLVVIDGFHRHPTSLSPFEPSMDSLHRARGDCMLRLREPTNTTSCIIGCQSAAAVPIDLIEQASLRVFHRLGSARAFEEIRTRLHLPAASLRHVLQLGPSQAIVQPSRARVAGFDDASLLTVTVAMTAPC